MIVLALLAALMAQDTTALSPRARAMLPQFPPPRGVDVSVVTRFSTDTAWIGEQVELVTATWFRRELRDRLRRLPSLRAPSLSGLWSVQSQSIPVVVAARIVDGAIYDLFISHQTLFPLGAGRIEAPPATLSFSVPASSSYFAPENRRTVMSRPVSLVVRGIPSSMTGALNGGPTARGLRLTWSTPSEGLRVGMPALVELILTGEGNMTLWPAPEVAWPPGMRIYPERTDERGSAASGRLGGEKRFRYTLVADSAGVVTLPPVRYAYFDPSAVQVHVMTAGAVGLPVLAGTAAPGRRVLPVAGNVAVPVATRVVDKAWWLLALVALLPMVLLMWRPRRPQPGVAHHPADPEIELRRLLGTPVEAGPERVAGALRRRGVPRDDAEAVGGWLRGLIRRRYGHRTADETVPVPGALPAIITLLRRMFIVGLFLVPWRVDAQDASAIARYRAGDYAGAAREFEALVQSVPHSGTAWRNVGAARAMSGDDVGAAAAWLRAFTLAPRDAILRDAWRQEALIPADVRALAPVVPASRDELLLLALAAWIVAAWAIRSRRRAAAVVAGAVLVGSVGVVLLRTGQAAQPRALVRPGTQLRVSPHPSAPILGDVAAWSQATLQRRDTGWWLVEAPDGRRGWVGDARLAAIDPVAR